jgi:cell wall-associated NlpC family hydrolase
VAIYLGGGQVVQAPHSGDVIRVTPIYEVEPGTMGATRPLT